MKKITIELDDAYSNIFVFTAIGSGSGYGTNVFTGNIDFTKSGNHWMLVRDPGVENMKLVEVTEVDHDKK